MESKWVEVMDNGHRNIRRRRATYCAANIIGASRKVVSIQSKHNSLVTRLGKRKRFGGNSTCGVHSRKSLVENYSNFAKSGLPQRFLFHEKGEWNDFPSEIVELVREAFQSKKAAIEVHFNGCHLMLDILYMMQVDLGTGSQKPIAWIDEAGSCFFPQLCPANGGVDEFNNYELEKGERSVYMEPNGNPEIKLHLQIEVNGSNLEELVEESNVCSKRIKLEQKLSRNDYEPSVNDNYSQKSAAKMDDVHDEVQQIGENLFATFGDVCGTVGLHFVRNMFIAGMKPSSDANIIEIRRCSSHVMQSRWEIFQKQVEITQKYRGNPNVQYAWLATREGEWSSIMTYGFTHYRPKVQAPYGIGVHLTSLKCALASANYCDEDENGVRHMVLCRVVLGNMEPVCPGSKQLHPTSEKFDSGVDDRQNPRHYIVWTMNMNTHIHPEYVVSFMMSHSAGAALGGKESRHDIPGVTTYQGHEVQYQLDLSSVESERNCNPCQGFKDKSQRKPPAIGSSTSKAPKSPWMPFTLLFDAISKKIAPEEMKLVNFHHNLFKSKKISRDEFIGRLRLIVGDQLLWSTIPGLQCKLPPNFACPPKPPKEE